jgi:hypothetical protein
VPDAPDQRSILRALDDTFERLRPERDTARAEAAVLRADVADLRRRLDDPGRPFTPDERLGNFQGRLHDLEDRVRALEARRPPRHRWRDGDPDGDLPESLRHIKGA